LVWFDRRSHHVVTFPGSTSDQGWVQALASWVKDGRTRSVEVRRVDGEPVGPESPTAAALRGGGFVEGYRGWVYRS
jgi:ATP-dependent Lhr-like helicase